MPAKPVDGVKATLERVLADDQIAVKQIDQPTLSAPSALSEEIIGPITQLSAEFFPGAVGAADHEHRRDRRQLPSQRRHPDLRTFRAGKRHR